MEQLEFYIYENELWCKTSDGRNIAITEDDTEIISNILNLIRSQYPDAFKALQSCYQKSAANTKYYQFLIVRRFCKCNFGKLDSTTADIDKLGRCNFERVECPLRGECPYEGIICNPKFNSKLSDAEMRVMKLYYQGMSKEEIGEVLYISPYTVKNQIKTSYLKLGVHEKAEFVKYVNQHNLFNN